MAVRDEKIIEIIRQAAAIFLQNESLGGKLITVTKVALTTDGGKANIFFTVLPEAKEDDTLRELKRKRTEFQEYMRDKTSLSRLPFFDFVIDRGEKNRQRLDSLTS